jgi:hypothetical protein
MSWDDVDNVVFDGNQNDIKNLGCPECGGKSGEMTKANGVFCVPNFVKFYW